jgi:heterodisulfide reductase subunit B2
MKYFYYPGCSLEGTATEYDRATRAVMAALGAELLEVEDWTCCGASAADAISYLLSMALPARNLALAQQMSVAADFLIPCSACYLNLRKVDDHLQRDGALAGRINRVLGEEGLNYQGGMKVRHLLEVLARDVGAEALQGKVTRPLTGLKIAPYYGCQVLRPYGTFDDPEQPQSMEALLTALGAEVFPWGMGARCCGAGLMTTKKPVALHAVVELLAAARGADAIATVCPMCQMNLDSFQSKAARTRGEDLAIPVLYLPQLMGLAMGLGAGAVKLNANMVVTKAFKTRCFQGVSV